MAMESERYPALRSIAKVYKIMAWIVAIVAGIIAFVALLTGIFKGGEEFQALFAFVVCVLGGAIGYISLLAISEGIQVFIDIEENTRRTRRTLEMAKTTG